MILFMYILAKMAQSKLQGSWSIKYSELSCYKIIEWFIEVEISEINDKTWKNIYKKSFALTEFNFNTFRNDQM